MRERSLFEPYRLRPYRVCPDCGARYAADAATRRRARVITVLAVVTAALSIPAYRQGFPWGLAIFLLGASLLAYSGYALSKMKFVPYPD